MESERSLIDWLLWPMLIIIVVTPLRFALEVAGISPQVTVFFSSTAFVYLLAACLGAAMADRIEKPLTRLLGIGFMLGYVNGFMVLIATLLSTYASFETHYRHHSLNVSDAQHVIVRHIVVNPLLTAVIACVVAALFFLVAQRIKRTHKPSEASTEDVF